MILSQITALLTALGVIGLAIGGVAWWSHRKGRKGATQAMKEADHENAEDIRRRVHDDRAERVRKLDTAGYRRD